MTRTEKIVLTAMFLSLPLVGRWAAAEDSIEAQKVSAQSFGPQVVVEIQKDATHSAKVLAVANSRPDLSKYIGDYVLVKPIEGNCALKVKAISSWKTYYPGYSSAPGYDLLSILPPDSSYGVQGFDFAIPAQPGFLDSSRKGDVFENQVKDSACTAIADFSGGALSLRLACAKKFSSGNMECDYRSGDNLPEQLKSIESQQRDYRHYCQCDNGNVGGSCSPEQPLGEEDERYCPPQTVSPAQWRKLGLP